MQIQKDSIAIYSIFISFICVIFILSFGLLNVNYLGKILLLIIVWSFMTVHITYLLDLFSYVVTDSHYYIFTNDINKIDETTKFINFNYHITKIPNLEKFKFLQNFKLKIDISNMDNSINIFNNPTALFYKLNLCKLEKLNIFEITLYKHKKIKLLTDYDIKYLHKDNYFMTHLDYKGIIPHNVTHINFLKTKYYDEKVINNLPHQLEYLKIYDYKYDLINLPITLKKLILIKQIIKINYGPDEYNETKYNHKIPFGCIVEYIEQIYYDYIYDL